MRERLRTEAAGAVLAWIVQGAKEWMNVRTSPPACVRALIDSYMAEHDSIGRWLEERCERIPSESEQSSYLYRDYESWCKAQRESAKSNMLLSRHLESLGLTKAKRTAGNVFVELKLKRHMEAMEASPLSPVHARIRNAVEMEQPSMGSIRARAEQTGEWLKNAAVTTVAEAKTIYKNAA